MNGSNLTREHSPLRAELVGDLLSSMRALGVHVGTRTDLEEATPEGVEALRAFVEVWSREPRFVKQRSLESIYFTPPQGRGEATQSAPGQPWYIVHPGGHLWVWGSVSDAEAAIREIGGSV